MRTRDLLFYGALLREQFQFPLEDIQPVDWEGRTR